MHVTDIIIVAFFPFIAPLGTPEISDQDVTVTQPDVAIFVCTAIAIPRPFFTWYRVEVDSSRTVIDRAEEGVSISMGNGDIANSTLEFNPTQAIFSAEYICEATNSLTTTEINATLTVNGMYP